MIRLLHAADLHLDSPFQSLRAAKALQRRTEQRLLPGRIAELARQREADILLLAGDVFDSDALFAETGRSLAKALAGLNIPVFIAPGNHDCYRPGSLWDSLELSDNVHVFSREAIECVLLPELGARVWGSAFTGHSRREPLAGFEAEKDGELVDIMLLHGEVGKPSSPYGPVTEEQLARSGMDYVALGHIHRFSGLQRAGETCYAWPGCTEGRGFDECGEKGVILAELEPGECRLEFIALPGRRYELLQVDITNCKDELSAVRAALGDRGKEDIYRIIFTGETEQPPDLALLQRELEGRFYALELRDETQPKRELWADSDEDSLRGLFTATLRRRYESAAGDEERRQIVQALRWGLRALDRGEELPL